MDERGPGDVFRLRFEAISRFNEEEQRVVRSVLESMILKQRGAALAVVSNANRPTHSSISCRPPDSDTLIPVEAKAIAEADERSKHNEPIPHDRCSPSLASPWPTGRR